jgi:hypothetical protein
MQDGKKNLMPFIPSMHARSIQCFSTNERYLFTPFRPEKNFSFLIFFLQYPSRDEWIKMRNINFNKKLHKEEKWEAAHIKPCV